MMTVVTYMTIAQGAEPEWDAEMRARLATATGRRGFVRSQLLIPLDGLNRRVIVGTWATRADWEAWHSDPAFLAARERLDELQEAPSEPEWYEVVEDQPPAGLGRAVDAAVGRLRTLAGGIAGRRAPR